ncbi:hypothetical protein HCN51_19765 [Nonomuraea sp. FMUSA5-5]|uniref:Uncharacterized protein n=1 Tax=Nonomuraea composti TaxID=2720023 RepID=A0ABX1B7E2_9ACTN|nr:hypothetical protein [Nonomuraea sp. FMUSA5-5]NJP91669.1 hypothetical protein [Nonomuraea sp. FMUSA5-5]
MSYLDFPRLTFAGRFLSDVPTGNNDPGSFGSPDPPQPSWNAYGCGTFDLLGCKVTGGESGPGQPLAAGHPALGLDVLTSPDQASAKLVDLDPDWQVSTEIWGLTVRLTGPRGESLLSGRFRPAAFRDLWGRGGDDGGFDMMSATFVSVLEEVAYGPAAAAVPLLAELRDCSPERLSIRFTMYGITAQRCTAAFATGRLTGCIGPWSPGEPLSFVAGRRLDMGSLTSETSFGRSVAVVRGDRLVLDLGNAYPFAASPGPAHPRAARIDVAVLPGEQVQAGDVLPPGADVIDIGTAVLLPSPPPSGVVSLPLPPQAAQALESRPLALLVADAGGGRRVLSRETRDGLYVRADGFVHRVEAGARATVTLHARERGAPAAGVTVHLARVLGDASVLTVPDSVVTGPDGTATVTLEAGDPHGPRPGLDGVVEQVAYSPRRNADGTLDLDGSGIDPSMDVIAAHVRDAHEPPAEKHLEDAVRRILAPYATHYPIMGEHLVNLGDLDAVRPWRAAMLLALSRDITDPNHMPVTRDLSEPKRATILRWLNGLPAAPRAMARSAPPPATGVLPPEPKLVAARDLVARGLSAARHLSGDRGSE